MKQINKQGENGMEHTAAEATSESSADNKR